VDNASYPTEQIRENSVKFRPLGLGFANLGATLMARGLAYDSEEGRAYAAALTALMCGEAYVQSARIAAHKAPFEEYEKNQEPFMTVMRKHQSHILDIKEDLVPEDLLRAARMSWAEVIELGEKHGFRNAQATVLAPTGTIAFMMDCDTTGIEPDLALVKYKKLVGGGTFKIVNNTVPLALRELGYSEKQVEAIVQYIDENDTIEGAPDLKPEHLPVFDCAFKPANGERSIDYMGHIRMMAATQPFLSGAISKTVNMPSGSTVEEIEKAYIESWKMGLKAVAIYRDGCKRTQPLYTTKTGTDTVLPSASAEIRTIRRKLDDTRASVTHKFSVAGHEGYITVGLYEDRKPGEIFITLGKAGSTLSGFADAFATAISFALQHGVELRFLVDKFSHVRFEPSGFTGNQQIPMAKSIIDYVFRWLALEFLKEDERPASMQQGMQADPDNLPSAGNGEGEASMAEVLTAREKQVFVSQADAPPCSECGTIMVRNGACYLCINCGTTSGCS